MNEKPFTFESTWAVQSIIVGLWLMIAVVITVRHFEQKPKILPSSLSVPVISESEKNKLFNVSKVVVIRGNYFDLTLKEGDIHLFGKLNVPVREEAKIKLLDLLNNVTKPTIVLRDKQDDGCWIIDFFVIDKDNKEINLAEWLSSNNLVIK